MMPVNDALSTVQSQPAISKFSKQTQYFRFLDLPAELRNRVYDSAINLEDGVARLKFCSGRETPRHVQPTLNRRIYPLTQVCKQVRVEFLPIYMRNLKINLHWTDVSTFLRTFYPEQVSGPGPSATYPKVLNVYIDYIKEGQKLEENQHLDLLPLLKMRHTYSDFSCSFLPSEELGWNSDPVYSRAGAAGIDSYALEALLNYEGGKWLFHLQAKRFQRIVIREFQKAMLPAVCLILGPTQNIEPGGGGMESMMSEQDLEDLGLADTACSRVLNLFMKHN